MKIYKLFRASDGIEALNIIKRESIDLAVVDIMMPNMNGISTNKSHKRRISISYNSIICKNRDT